MIRYNIDAVVDELIRVSCGEIFATPNPDIMMIKEFESRHGVLLSDDHVVLLVRASNIYFGNIDVLTITKGEDGQRELYEALKYIRCQGVSRDWIPVCESNGDYFCVDSDGVVHFWSHNGPTDEKWESLAHWVKQVWIDEG